MLQATIFSLLVFLALGLAAQVPLSAQSHHDDGIRAIFPPENLADWSLDQVPHPNATDHLVFETVHSLLQHWPNTRMRNGHNIVPGTIPKGTLLYHGAASNGLPPGPEWVATDPEHSYFFCRDLSRHFQQQGCWHLTLATIRPLKVVYFDGSSAVKIPYGSMDTQDLIIYGKIGEGVFDERTRIRDLCDWGRNFGVDGFVRMEMDFEVMLCDFTAGVSVVSFSNLVSRGWGSSTSRPVLFEVMNSGSWHNHFPGETRVQLDLAGLISFYDIELVPSLVDIRADQERWDHRVQNTSSEDLSAVKSRLEAALTRSQSLSSGIDWQTLVQVIVDRYAGRLELTRYFFNSTATEPVEVLDLAKKTQTQLRIMLTPYILLSATPTDDATVDWAIPVFKLCATTHTYTMDSEFESMTESERLLLQAVRGTTREICRVVTKMWAAGVSAGLDPVLNTKESPDIAGVVRVWNGWAEDLGSLMAWLDWNVWVKCNPECDIEEMCYLPTWPSGFPRSPRRGPGRGPPPPSDPNGPPPRDLTSFELRAMVIESLGEELENAIMPGPDDWIRPQPRCVRRVEPLEV